MSDDYDPGAALYIIVMIAVLLTVFFLGALGAYLVAR